MTGTENRAIKQFSTGREQGSSVLPGNLLTYLEILARMLLFFIFSAAATHQNHESIGNRSAGCQNRRKDLSGHACGSLQEYLTYGNMEKLGGTNIVFISAAFSSTERCHLGEKKLLKRVRGQLCRSVFLRLGTDLEYFIVEEQRLFFTLLKKGADRWTDFLTTV